MMIQSTTNCIQYSNRPDRLEDRNRQQRKMWVEVLNQGVDEGYFRADLDVDLIYRFIRDTTWVSVRWYQPGGPLTAEQVGQQQLPQIIPSVPAAQTAPFTWVPACRRHPSGATRILPIGR
jgi:hypothetical protein